MTRTYFAAVVAVALGLCACLPAATEKDTSQAKDSAQQQIPKQATGEISGHVYRSDTGEPVAKAVVSLYPQNERTTKAIGNSRVTRTGADGAFAFSDLPPGEYAIGAWRNGFANSSIMWKLNFAPIILHPGQRLEKIELHLIPAGVITGSLVDEDGEPVAAVHVQVVRINYLPGGRREIYLTSSELSDDQGNFRIAALPPGSYYVRAGGLIQRPKFQVALKEGPGGGLQYRDTYFPGSALLDEAQPVEVSPGAESGNLRIAVATEKTYTITGAIVGAPRDAKLKPTELRVERRSVAQQMWNWGAFPLNSDGSYSLRMLPPGEYTLTAIAIKPDDDSKAAQEIDQGFASVRVVDSDVRADIQIGRAGEVRGNVDAPAGFSFKGRQIILETTGSRYYPSDIDSTGGFDIRNTPPGEYTISLLDRKSQTQFSYIKQAMCSGGDIATQPLELSLDAVQDCKITVADDVATLNGQVTDGDVPAAGRVVALIPQARALRRIPSFTLTANTDSAGMYKLAGVIPGNYFLLAVPQDEDHAYFALDFAERHPANARRVSVGAREMQVVDLSPSKAQ
jgi:protocatechuate 3,4-dioxygenase beta subunit